MQILQGRHGQRKGGGSERFETLLPLMVEAVEVEWRQRARLMNIEEQSLLRQAHQALGTLRALWDGAP